MNDSRMIEKRSLVMSEFHENSIGLHCPLGGIIRMFIGFRFIREKEANTFKINMAKREEYKTDQSRRGTTSVCHSALDRLPVLGRISFITLHLSRIIIAWAEAVESPRP